MKSTLKLALICATDFTEAEVLKERLERDHESDDVRTPSACDATLFARADGVEAAWHIVQPILELLMPLHEYEPHTWGPRQADRLIEGGWHNPQVSG